MIKEIQTNCAIIRKALDEQIDPTNPQEVIGKLNELSNLLGLSAHTTGLAEQDLNQAQYQALQKIEDRKQTEQKIILNNACKYEVYFLNYSERLNKELHYKIESLRSILSYAKEELNKISYQ